MHSRCQTYPKKGKGPEPPVQAQNYLESLPLSPVLSEDRLKEGVEVLKQLKDFPTRDKEEAALVAIQQGKILNAFKKAFSNDYLWGEWNYHNLYFLPESRQKKMMLLADRTYLHKFAKLGIQLLLDTIKIVGNVDAEAAETFIRRNFFNLLD